MQDTMEKVSTVLGELVNAIDQYEDMNGSNEFTEGALAVIHMLVGAEGAPETVEEFVKHYLAER